MPRFVLSIPPGQAFAAVFKSNPDSFLEFGWSAKSTRPADQSVLENEQIIFQDYIMEGFIQYAIQLKTHSQGCELIVTPMGSNRDQYILPQVRHFITAAEIAIAQESK